MYYELYFEEHKSYQKSYHNRDGGIYENLGGGGAVIKGHLNEEV